MLDERKLKTIELLAQGIHYTDISKQVGVSRQTIYDWLKDEEFKAELDRWRQEFINCTRSIFAFNAPKAARKIVKQIDSSNEKIANTASQYVCDATCGKPTTKVEQVNDTENKNIDDDILDKELDEVDHNSNE